MSSVRSPDLRLDLATDWRVVGGLSLWLALTVATVWQADLRAWILVPVTLTVLFLGLSVVASQRFGGGGRGPRTLLWSGTGKWGCIRADGSSEELELSPESRVFPGGALLVFRHARSLRWLLLLQHRQARHTLRRLCGRLVLERQRQRAGGRPGVGHRRQQTASGRGRGCLTASVGPTIRRHKQFEPVHRPET